MRVPPRSSTLGSIALVAVLVLGSDAFAQAFREGPEFQVNSFTGFVQRSSAVAWPNDDGFVVVWQSYHDGQNTGVFGQRFSSSGARLGAELQINAHTTDFQFDAAIAGQGDGRFVVAWNSRNQDGDDYGIFARLFSSSGDPIGDDLQVNSYTVGNQTRAAVAADAEGDFVVAWEGEDQDGANGGIFAQRWSSAGTRLGGEIQVNEFTSLDQRVAAVAAEPDGDFVVTWQSRGQDGNAYGIFGRRFASDGSRLGVEFLVNSATVGYQTYAAPAITPGGGFVVAWQSLDLYGSGWNIFARRFDSAGSPIGVDFAVNTDTLFYEVRPAAATDASGGFVVVWSSDSAQDGSGNGVFGQSFSSAGTALVSEFQVNTRTTGNQYETAVAGRADGNFVVTWTSRDQDGNETGIFAQRFAPGIPLDIDGDGAVEPLTDGLLVLRYLFSFTGTTLTNGAVGSECTRCDASTIEPHLDGLGNTLDIDGDGAVEPLTDGLLVLRYLFSFTGTTLTAGAVGDECTRCDAAAIEPHLAGLV
jgi:hypothetical protein